MKKMLVEAIIDAMMIMNAFNHDEKNNVGNNILATGKVIEIEYSENPESKDKLYFDVEGHIYEIIDFAEDMFIGDDVLVCIDMKGTESQKDDVIMMWRYWRSDLHQNDLPKDVCNKESQETQNHLYDIMKSLKDIVKRKAERDL